MLLSIYEVRKWVKLGKPEIGKFPQKWLNFGPHLQTLLKAVVKSLEIKLYQ